MIEGLTIPAVVGAAFVDAINPCAFAVLIILMTTVLARSNKKKALYAGLCFSLAVFISYFLMGVGLFSALRATGATRIFYIIVTVLAYLLGILNIKDYYWYGKGILMEVPRKWRPSMKGLIQKVTSPSGAFIVGFLVSLFLLPCTSGPYIIILGLLADQATKFSGLMYLLLYNLIFVFPMVLITILVYKGLSTTERLEALRQKKLKILHLIAGIIMILLGAGMTLALYLGWI